MAEPLNYLLADRDATARWGRALGKLLRPGDLLALVGDLGAGKTTLTGAIAAGMEIQDEVTSPTFTLVQEYRGRIPMFHLDPYRLQRAQEFYDSGFEEYLERDGVTVIEWADRLSALLPSERLTLALEIVSEKPERDSESEAGADRSSSLLPSLEDVPRRLTAQAVGRRYEDLLDRLASQPEVVALQEKRAS